MELLEFAGTVVLITASGALAPGPLFFANLSQGSKIGARGGLIFSLAHTIVEFTLVMALALGLLTLVSEGAVRLLIGAVGGIALIAFGGVQIWISLTSKFLDTTSQETHRNVFLIGLSFTGLNPFFVIWWLTAGAQLIFISLEFASLAGVLFMYICHVWMDYAWLASTAHLAKKGHNIIGFRMYRWILTFFSIILVYYGLTFLISSIDTLSIH